MAEKTTKKDVFVGREEEIQTIKNILKDNPKANILISGLTGMGKTELCMRVKKLLSQDKSLHCGSYRVESKLEDPVNPFLTALAEVFQSITNKEPAESKLKWFKNVFAKEIWKKRKDIGVAVAKDGVGTILKNIEEKLKLEVGETTATLADIMKDASAEWSTKSTLEKLLVENKPAVISTYLGLLRQISEQSPNGHKFVLIFDQVENTSNLFQEFLISVARNLPDKFYCILALNDEIPDGRKFWENYHSNLQFFGTQEVELPGLSFREINGLIEKTRGLHQTPDIVENVRKLSGGRPFLIIQWINSKDFDLSVINEKKFSLYGFYADNLIAVEEDAQKLANILSLLPLPLQGGLDDYAGIMGIEPFKCSHLLGQLESKNIFRRYEVDLCWFSHELIKQYIFDNMYETIKKDFALQIISYLKKKCQIKLEAPKLSDEKSVYAELLPFTEDHQASFDQNYGLGQYHYRISSYETAKRCFDKALKAAEQLKDRKKVSDVLNEIGVIYNAWGEFKHAIEYYQKSLNIKEELGDQQGEGVILNNIGEIYRTRGESDQAIEYYQKSLKIQEEIGDRKGKGVTLNNIGEIYRAWGKYDQAIEYYEKNLKLFQEIGDRIHEGGTLNNIGLVYDAWGKYDQAIEYYKKDLKICQETGDRQGEGVSLNNIAGVYYARGKYDQAIEYYKKSLKIFEDIGDRKNEGVTLNNIGGVYYAWGKYDRAIEYYKKSLKIIEEVGDRKGEGVTLNNIGEIYRAWGKYDQAIEYYQSSLKITEEIGDRQGEGVTMNNIGLVYDAWGKYDRAIEYYKKSLKIIEKVGDRKGEGLTLSNIGMVYDAWGKYDQAIEYYKKSLKILEEIGAVEAKTVRENLKQIQEEMRKR